MDAAAALDRLMLLAQSTDVEPELSYYDLAMCLELARTADSAGVEPTEEGWVPTYSRQGLYRAAAEAWTIRKAKAAGYFNFATDGQTFFRSQVVDHCDEMIKRFLRRTNQSVPL